MISPMGLQLKENFVFWFSAQFNSTHNFTQSGWRILFIPGLLYGQQKLGKLPNTSFLAGQRCPVQTSHWWLLNSSSSSMDTWGNLSFRPRNPSWIWIRYIQYTTTGTTLCHRDALIPLSTPSSQFTSRPLHGDQRTPLHQTHKTHGDSKVHFLLRQHGFRLTYGEHNPSHIRRYALPFSTLSYLHFVSLLTILLTTSLAAQTQTTFSMQQIKTILKNTFRLSASYFFFILLLFTLQT